MGRLSRIFNTVALVYYRTPAGLRWVYWLIPLLYFLFPFDFLPDVIPFLGRVDDILLVLIGFWALDRAKNYFGFFKEAKQKGQAGPSQDRSQEQAGRDQTPHEVLGVARNASKAEIKQAYRKLLTKYHPDKFSHLGNEFERIAQERTRRIVSAYEQLTGSRKT